LKILDKGGHKRRSDTDDSDYIPPADNVDEETETDAQQQAEKSKATVLAAHNNKKKNQAASAALKKTKKSGAQPPAQKLNRKPAAPRKSGTAAAPQKATPKQKKPMTGCPFLSIPTGTPQIGMTGVEIKSSSAVFWSGQHRRRRGCLT
jgi:sRNA-binding protein